MPGALEHHRDRRWAHSAATRDACAIAALVVAFLVMFAPIWGAGRVFRSDNQYAAFFAPVALWSDAWIGGWPAGADAASYVFYPLRILLRPTGSFNAFVVTAYAIAASGLYGYLRVVGLSSASAFLGGLSFACSGFMIGHLSQTSMIHAVAWITPALASIEAALSTGHRRWAWLTVLAVAMSVLTGHFQLTAYGLVVLATYLAYRLPFAWRAGRIHTWLISASALVVGVSLAAPFLLLAWDYLAETPRHSLDFKTFVSLALPIRQLASMYFPFVFGGGIAPYAPQYFGDSAIADITFHMPLLVLLFAADGLRARPHGLYWMAVGAVSFVAALGDQVPVVAELLYRVPGLNLFRGAGRHVMQLCLALSILAALGFEARLERRRSLAAWLPPLLVIAGFFLAFRWVLNHYGALGIPSRRSLAVIPPWQSNPALLVPAALAAIGAGAYLLVGGRSRRGLKVAVGLAAVVIQAFAFGAFAHYAVRSPTRAALAPTELERRVLEYLRATPGRVVNLRGSQGTIFTPERSRLFAVPSLNWYGQLVPKRASDLLGVTAPGVMPSAPLTPGSSVFDVYGVRYVVVEGTGGGLTMPAAYPDRWRLLGIEGTNHAFENLRANPLAWLVGSWRPSPEDETLAIVRGDDNFDGAPFGSAGEALVEDLAAARIDAFDPGRVDARWLGAGELEVGTTSSSGGLLMTGISHFRGWEARLDGMPVPIHRADYALLAVRIPPGRHTLRLTFAPGVWRPGVVVALAALLGFALLYRWGPMQGAQDGTTDVGR